MRSSFLGQSHASAAESAGFQAARPVLATTTASRSPSSSLVVYAGPAGRARRNAGKGPTPKPPPGMPKRPDSRFFADTDPNATIYPVRSSLQGDITKRGGRWQSDFIWNQNWKDALDYEESVRKLIEEGRKEKAAGITNGGAGADGKGFLSLTSKVDLNSMDVDLSAQLKPRPRNLTSSSSSQGDQRRLVRTSAAAAAAGGDYPRVPATRGEVRAWDRSGRYSRKVIPTPPTEAEAEEVAARLAEETARYDELKKELYSWAVGLTAACFTATFVFYGRDVAASYGIGALGGLLYLRLLNRSMDGLGAGGMGAALGSNRLLIPLILTLGYNRYNLLLAEDTGLTLQLLPILVGFFTYKGAVIARQSLLLFEDLAAPYTSSSSLSSSLDSVDQYLNEDDEDNSTNGGGGGRNVTNVDRAFAKKILQG